MHEEVASKGDCVRDDDLEHIVEGIQSEIHQSARISLVQYIENLVDEEVRKVVKSKRKKVQRKEVKLIHQRSSAFYLFYKAVCINHIFNLCRLLLTPEFSAVVQIDMMLLIVHHNQNYPNKIC